MNENEWREKLSPREYEVLREKGTESAHSGEYVDEKRAGAYVCAGCGQTLFDSETKFDSGTGWPSFFAPAGAEAVKEAPDHSGGVTRTEVMCHACDGHLGHVFPDGPAPTGLRYCMNSVSLKFEAREGEAPAEPS